MGREEALLSLYVSGKLLTYPSPKSTLTLTSHLGKNVGLGEGQVGSFPETYNDPFSSYDIIRRGNLFYSRVTVKTHE